MAEKLSEELISITNMVMVAKERSEFIRVAGALTGAVERAMQIERMENLLPKNGKEELSAVIKFTQKEVMKMPTQFRKNFKLNGYSVHARKRRDYRYHCSYEIRYARKPYEKRPISASGRTLEEAKENFIKKINEYIISDENSPAVPKDFHGFAMYWFENFHKRKTIESTYDHDIKLYKRHIKSRFEQFTVGKINAVMIQDFLDEFSDRGKTAKDLHSLIKQIFDCAVKHGLTGLNPIGMCVLDGYDQEHGTLITKEEEKKLLETYKGTEWEIPFAVVIYCGLRPCEYLTARIDGSFIKAQNGKRKDGKIEYKRIAITPMLRPYLNGITELKMPKPRILNRRYQKVLPNHQLYDMRTTFQTRCTECKMSDAVIGYFMGNSIGKLKNAYTDFSEEHLLSEGEKLKY